MSLIGTKNKPLAQILAFGTFNNESQIINQYLLSK
jgi:hypothetical protein